MPAVTKSNFAPSPNGERAAVERACRAALNGGSKSFYAASLLLPRSFARDATALYAFCRLTDDLIDNAVEASVASQHTDSAQDLHHTSQAATQRVLQSLYQRLDQLYAGQPYPHAADQALSDVVERHQLPKALLLSLYEGFTWDAQARDYETIDEVIAYGARVAGTVGVMMAVLMGVRDLHMVARAADLGVAMQLTNIARDVGEDARAGRLYLPRTWLREVGIDPDDFLATPVASPALSKVIKRMLDLADELYNKADSGIALLPGKVRPAMYAARLLYSEIGTEVRKLGYNSVDQRAFVSAAGKAKALSRLAKLPFLSISHLREPALEQTEYLVESIVQSIESSTTQELKLNPLSGISDKAVWVLDLFDELDKRDAKPRTV